MNFSELCTEVYNITKRPDLVAQTESAVRKATLRLHRLDFWSKDATDIVITWTAEAYQQSWSPKTSSGALTGSPRWRAVRYAIRVDPTTNLPVGKPLEYWEPGIGTYDAYGEQKKDVWYEAGTQYIFQFSVPTIKLAIGGYLDPNVATGAYASWIADDYPYAIVYDAAATLVRSIGFTDIASNLQADLAIELQALRTANVQTIGY